MSKSQKKIEEALEGLDTIKREQILSEIKSIKVNSIIAILTAIGSIIAFVVVNHKEIKDLINKDPKISYICSDSIINRIGEIEIHDANGKIKAQTDLKNLTQPIDLTVGSYTSLIKVENKTIWEENFILNANEWKKLIIPNIYKGSIKVILDNLTPKPLPGQKIDVIINSSGKGYLWIYEILNNKAILRFPNESMTKTNGNEILATAPFEFPDSLSLVAGDTIKKETYMFIVTSVNEQSYADEISNLLFKNSVAKGEIKKLEKNWGEELLSVSISR